jgi:hypothetical protein
LQGVSMGYRIFAVAAAAVALAITSTSMRAQDELRLNGVVVDEQGAPAADVDVSIAWYRDGRAEAATAADGSFELALPRQRAAGQLLRATADGGRRQAYFMAPWDLATLPRGPLKLELAPAKRVEVQVIDGEGSPIEGATVGLMGLYWTLEFATTDAAGQAVLWSPHGMEGHYLFAFSREHGIDYHAYVLRRGEAGDTRAVVPPLPDEPVEFTLANARPVRVTVAEADGGPLAGVRVYPWLLQKSGEPDNLNMSYFVDVVAQTTDNEGVAEFPWIPAWQEGLTSFWPSSDAEEFVHTRANYDPQKDHGQVRMKLERLVPMRGRVTRPDGAPAAGVEILARGEDYQMDGFRGSAVTDDDGHYEIKAAPNMVYLVIASDAHNGRWAAAPQTGFALRPGEPRENVDFPLHKATRVFGRVTVGPERAPVEGQRIEIYQYGEAANDKVDLPNPENSRKWVCPMTVVSTTSDVEGRFELFIGPGEFDIRGPQQVEIRKFTNGGEPEREFDFHSPRKEKGLLRGLVVVEGGRASAAAGATVTGIYRHGLAGRDLMATADAQGKFEVERELHRTVLYARSADRKLAGVMEIGPDDKVGVVVIRPTATVTGRLVGADRNLMAGEEITFGTRVHMGDDDAPFRTSFGGKTTTDENGVFTLENVVLNVQYEVSVTIREADAPQNASWRRIYTITMAEAQPKDLGDVSYEARE